MLRVAGVWGKGLNIDKEVIVLFSSAEIFRTGASRQDQPRGCTFIRISHRYFFNEYDWLVGSNMHGEK